MAVKNACDLLWSLDFRTVNKLQSWIVRLLDWTKCCVRLLIMQTSGDSSGDSSGEFGNFKWCRSWPKWRNFLAPDRDKSQPIFKVFKLPLLPLNLRFWSLLRDFIWALAFCIKIKFRCAPEKNKHDDTHTRDHISRISFYYASSIKIFGWWKRECERVMCGWTKFHFGNPSLIPHTAHSRRRWRTSGIRYRYFTSWYWIRSLSRLDSLSLRRMAKANNTIRMTRLGEKGNELDRAWKNLWNSNWRVSRRDRKEIGKSGDFVRRWIIFQQSHSSNQPCRGRDIALWLIVLIDMKNQPAPHLASIADSTLAARTPSGLLP